MYLQIKTECCFDSVIKIRYVLTDDDEDIVKAYLLLMVPKATLTRKSVMVI